MNIFFLHLDPRICAQQHCSKHVIKMILESIQLLSSAHHLHPNKNGYKPPYKLTHKNHPSAIWVRESLANYLWLCNLVQELSIEYTYRYGKIHKCDREGYINDLLSNYPDIPDIQFTSPRLAMPNEYKSNDPVKSYRLYYLEDKQRMLSWDGNTNNRSPPKWFIEHMLSKLLDVHNIHRMDLTVDDISEI